MAEIPIQRKESRNWLPLILGVLALLALAFYFLRPRGETAATGPADSTAAVTAPAPATDSATAAPAAGARSPSDSAR